MSDSVFLAFFPFLTIRLEFKSLGMQTIYLDILGRTFNAILNEFSICLICTSSNLFGNHFDCTPTIFPFDKMPYASTPPSPPFPLTNANCSNLS